jgi:hypothetical protein
MRPPGGKQLARPMAARKRLRKAGLIAELTMSAQTRFVSHVVTALNDFDIITAGHDLDRSHWRKVRSRLAGCLRSERPSARLGPRQKTWLEICDPESYRLGLPL